MALHGCNSHLALHHPCRQPVAYFSTLVCCETRSVLCFETKACIYARLCSRKNHQDMMGRDSGTSSSQSQPQSVPNSQTSLTTSTTDGPSTADAAAAMLRQRYASHDSHLHHLSAVAAVQDRLHLDPDGPSRKRMADGEVKDRRSGSLSPLRGHARTTSAVSVASTTGSTIGELSAELRTRLSYAMVKVNHGWQSRSLDEVESLASQGASPTSSTSTVYRGNGSLASPRLPVSAPQSQTYYVKEPAVVRRSSHSPPSSLSNNKPTLAPPATIQPSLPMSAPGSNPRRNSSPRYTPTMLSHSHSASPSAQSTPISNGHPRAHSTLEPIIQSPHRKNMREQDAIETLLFMSSPGNSANLKRSFSPSASPGPRSNKHHHHHHHHHLPPRSIADKNALPSTGSRRGLPSNRPPLPAKKVGFDKSPGVPPPPASPIDLDSPQQQQYHTPNKSTPKRHSPGHRRSALSLPSGLGLGKGTSRKVLRDEDIERMLDRAGAELGDSSDDEEIQLPPPGRNGLARVMGA